MSNQRAGNELARQLLSFLIMRRRNVLAPNDPFLS